MQVLRSIAQFRGPAHPLGLREAHSARRWAPVGFNFTNQRLLFLQGNMSTHRSESSSVFQKRLFHQTSVEPIHQRFQSQSGENFYFPGALATAIVVSILLSFEDVHGGAGKRVISSYAKFLNNSPNFELLSHRLNNPLTQIFPKTWFPPPPKNFVGRDSQLEAIHKKCKKGSRVVVTGSQGRGKTSLCKQYAEEYQNDYYFIRYIPGDRIESTPFELADELEIPKYLETEQRLKKLKEKLDGIDQDYLLIIDQVDDSDSMKSLLSWIPQKGVLLSSRDDSLFKEGDFEKISLAVMAEDEAVEYLASIVPSNDYQQLKSLAGELGQLPLALEYAASSIKQTGMSFQAYLDEYKKHSVVFESGEYELDKEGTIILKTITMNLLFIKNENKEPFKRVILKASTLPLEWFGFPSQNKAFEIHEEMLNFFSILGNAPISQELLYECFKALFPTCEDAQIKIGLSHLCAYALVASSPENEYEVHSFTQDVINHQLSIGKKEEMLSKLVLLINDLLEDENFEDVSKRQSILNYIPHIEKIIEQILDLKIQDLEVVKLLRNCGNFYAHEGQYALGLKYSLYALELAKEVFGEKSANVAACYRNIGNAYYRLGEYKEALQYSKFSLNLLKNFSNEKDLSAAEAYDNFGSVLESVGEYGRAVEYLNKSVKLKRELLEKDFWSNFEYLKRFIEYLNKYVKIKIRNDASIIDIGRSYNNLGVALHSLKQYEEASKYFEISLDQNRALYGEDHPNTASSYDSLGCSLRNLKKYDEALKFLKMGLEIRRKIFGENHPSIADSYENIAAPLIDMGKYAEGLQYRLKALELRIKLLGDEHPYTANNYGSVGDALEFLGRHEEALEYKMKALELRRKKLGEDHRDTADSYDTVAVSHESLGDKEEAQACRDKAQAIRDKLKK